MNRCPHCDRPVGSSEDFSTCRAPFGDECDARKIDWRTRALTAEKRAEGLMVALRKYKAWVGSDAVVGMCQIAALHGYSLESAWQEQGKAACEAVEQVLATAAPRDGQGGER